MQSSKLKFKIQNLEKSKSVLSPKIGIGVLVLNKSKILLLKRQGSHGEGQWCFPGGHLEFGEKITECVTRETYEEAGIKIKDIKIICVNEEMDFIKTNNKHYITIGCISTYKSGDLINQEPQKCLELGWFSLDNLPSPLFIPTKNIIQCYKQNCFSLIN